MEKKILLAICAAAMTAGACNSQFETGDGRGTLFLSLSNASRFELSKAVDESDYSNTDDYNVVITAGNGREVLNCTGGELAGHMPKTLEMGTYKVVASYGTESPASRDGFRVEGAATIVLQPRDELSVEIECSPTCGKIYAEFDPEMDTYYSSYGIEFGGTEALGGQTVTYAQGDTEPWYVKLLPEGETVTYRINLTTRDEYRQMNRDGEITKTACVTGEFKLLRNRARRISVKPNYTPSDDGKMGLNIIIDGSTEEKDVKIEVPIAWI